MKRQTEYTFNEARSAAIEHLSVLASFAESLHTMFSDEALLEWAIALRSLQAKVEEASGRCLSHSEIKQVWGFGQELIRANPSLTSKLSHFWKLYDDVLKKLRSTQSSPGYAPRGVIAKLRPRISRTDSLAFDIVSAAQSHVSSILSATSLLLVHVVRTETIEFALRKQFEDAIEKHGLQGKYDVEDICSVQSKVTKGAEWQSTPFVNSQTAVDPTHYSCGCRLAAFPRSWQANTRWEFHACMHSSLAFGSNAMREQLGGLQSQTLNICQKEGLEF